MKSKITYRDYYVAFLDILGFSNIVKNQGAEYIHKIFSNVRKAKKYVKKDRGGRKNEETKFYFFSDTIVCAIPASEENALESIASNCMLIQHALWSFGSPIWLRGAIARGQLYCGDGEIFGPALVEAYKMEENLAIYPRIVMTVETYNNGIEESLNEETIDFVIDTDDGLKMVETFGAFKFLKGTDTVKEMVMNELRKQTDKHIRDKYLWVKKHYNEHFAKDEEERI